LEVDQLAIGPQDDRIAIAGSFAGHVDLGTGLMIAASDRDAFVITFAP
jgi:hypothetical protein